MPIALVDRAVAALAALDLAAIEEVPPAERRRLADVCRHVANVADPAPRQAPAFRSSAGEHTQAGK